MRTREVTLVGCGLLVGLVLSHLGGVALSGASRTYTRLTVPRVTPIPVGEFTPEQKAAVGENARPNLNLRTALYEPELGKRWWSWLTFVWNAEARKDSALTLYDKELVILRVNYLCNDDWVWGQHVPIAKRNGRTEQEIARIPKGARAAGWTEKDRLLLTAVEELHQDYFISDTTWNGLAKIYNTRQMLDLIFTVGNYHLNAMYTNSVGMPFEQGFGGIPR